MKLEIGLALLILFWSGLAMFVYAPENLANTLGFVVAFVIFGFTLFALITYATIQFDIRRSQISTLQSRFAKHVH